MRLIRSVCDPISIPCPGSALVTARPPGVFMAHLRDCGRVLYARAKQALDRLNQLLDHSRGTRMPSVAIYGDSGMGKTMIMKRFRAQHPPTFNSLTGTLRTPVLAMEMTSRPGERRFYAELLSPARGTAAAASRYRPDGAGYAG